MWRIPAIGVQGVEGLSIDLATTWARLREQRDFFAGNATAKAQASFDALLAEAFGG